VADPKLARIRSIDLLRGADVLLMLFVNEVAGVAGAPAFLRHKGAADDGIGRSPTWVFSRVPLRGRHGRIPFALGSRLARGESRLAVLPPRGRARGRARRDRRADGERRARRPRVVSLPAWNVLDDARRGCSSGACRAMAGAGVIRGRCEPSGS
jgi:hypothetical protein